VAHISLMHITFRKMGADKQKDEHMRAALQVLASIYMILFLLLYKEHIMVTDRRQGIVL
jgi:hypothetical protein